MKIITNPIELAKKLVSIKSESGNEEAVTKFIFNYLASIGLKPKLQKIEKNRNNVFVVGQGPVLFNCHIDTIPIGQKTSWQHNPLGEIKTGKLFGRGSCDTKGNAACILSALAKNPSRNVSCSFTVGEENTMVGVRQLMKLRRTNLKQIKYCVNLEPTELKIISAHKGRMFFTVLASGKAAHGSVPSQGDNAIVKLANVTLSINKFATSLKKIKHPILGNPTLNIGVIKGGVMANIVPDKAEIEVDVRILPNQGIKQFIANFTKAAKPAKVELISYLDPVELKINSDIIEKMKLILKELGLESKSQGIFYTTEFSELKKHNIQGLIFGAGSINQAHMIDEYVKIKELQLCHQALGKLIKIV
ncbi:MAG: M20 family metallopeptidase [Patescibacteria group bacterium]